ncbi:DUF1045 domain-containing protein [Thalassobius sp. S69A]|uniref:DUF1045 domain-containing protein n=1 Tax=unclassified Thalassovita TaxID=2619711 RepID=UPI000C0C624C|nr:phosphonate metabolism protein [Paracoccaceae bacterium]MBT24843.1 phosphonate metabolism protein [Paracoccaceae bacterium]|tara:strand:- start:113 stop:796 length:684 start_codon:yes stop_codon:yes gene_type:complete
MTEFRRYAIYYVPEPGPLADFGASWLGWDLAKGAAVGHPDLADVDVAQVTQTPRKYGLHGTIKPPFRLAEGVEFAQFQTAARGLCKRTAPVRLEGLELTRLGGFLALTALGDLTELNALAGQTVTQLDAFRAPLNESELERRRKSRLTERQEALLTAWGYPYVQEEFRFHITLTGRMPRAEAAALRDRLLPLLSPLLPVPFEVQSLCLVGEDAAGMFHLIERLPLLG